MNGLEALRRLEIAAYRCHDETARTVEDLDKGISDEDYQAVQTIRKELKALEIIRTKRVNVWDVLTSSDLHMYNYNVNTWVFSGKELTQDEFDLLREAMK